VEPSSKLKELTKDVLEKREEPWRKKTDVDIHGTMKSRDQRQHPQLVLS